MAARGVVKVLHCVFSYLPDPPGGTEIYVQDLCRELRAFGVESAVVAPGRESTHYAVDGIRTYRIGGTPAASLAELYGAGDRSAADAFDAVLRAEVPDVVHQHALTHLCSVEWARRARHIGRPLVVTVHTPTFTCVRGTLMRWGREVCDGRLDATTCTACTLEGHRLPRPLSDLVARLPASVAAAVHRTGRSGPLWTALQLRGLISDRHRHVREFFGHANRVVSLSPWTRRLLELNGIAPDVIADVPHGVTLRAARAAPRRETGPLRVVHLGRLDPTKGTALLIDAVRGAASSHITLDVLGVAQDSGHVSVADDLRARANGDARITFHPPVAHEHVVPLLSGYDLLAVPSQWMETGPLVVLEAFAAGVPVLGSDLGGVADKIKHEIDGLLVRPHDSRVAWTRALERCAADRALVERLRSGVPVPRTTADVARDMSAIYRDVAARATGSIDRRGGQSVVA